LVEGNKVTDSMQGAIAAEFDAQRARLISVAERVLGSRADAEDAVQEAWFRLARQDSAAIDNLGGWLTTVVSRVCIDMLRSRAAKRELLYGDHVPELIVIEESSSSPESNTLLADSVGTALLVVLDSLDPSERLAFVLHDLFALPFEDIGPIVGRTPNAAKMLASRARRKVHGSGSANGRAADRAIVDKFLRAARTGDIDGLIQILDPNVTSRTHTARGITVTNGATNVAKAALRGGRAATTEHAVLVNGEPGIVAQNNDGKVVGVMACAISNGRIVSSSRSPIDIASRTSSLKTVVRTDRYVRVDPAHNPFPPRRRCPRDFRPVERPTSGRSATSDHSFFRAPMYREVSHLATPSFVLDSMMAVAASRTAQAALATA
jgi:RNA polymerase sigma factor (sigma-70 family)